MLRIDSKNMNFNGSSIINDNCFASFNANVNEPENNGYLHMELHDIANVRANLAAIKADFTAFLDEILRLPSSNDDE